VAIKLVFSFFFLQNAKNSACYFFTRFGPCKILYAWFCVGKGINQYEPSITLVPEGVAHGWSQSEDPKVTLVPEGVATLLRVAVLHQHMLNNALFTSHRKRCNCFNIFYDRLFEIMLLSYARLSQKLL
jgi:hypothetical protein